MKYIALACRHVCNLCGANIKSSIVLLKASLRIDLQPWAILSKFANTHTEIHIWHKLEAVSELTRSSCKNVIFLYFISETVFNFYWITVDIVKPGNVFILT